MAITAAPKEITDAEVLAVMRESFKESGIAKLDRLTQNELQAACTAANRARKDLDPATRERLQKAALESVKYPSDGKYLGDWKRGEQIAQSGRGLQFTDGPNTVNGGNCYACHQLTKEEISFGNIGPSLYNYGKLRGQSEAILKYTWARIWNSHAFNACANMPRFGDAGILTEAQIKDVMALLLDPESPVNK
ncbi:MAG: sulfur oxidation c-type cytochrome SoxX [Burkholderiales bacterium]|nr:sulfur oxidation c-type cytochrome SoxX [Burkholderiales bacterium]